MCDAVLPRTSRRSASSRRRCWRGRSPPGPDPVQRGREVGRWTCWAGRWPTPTGGPGRCRWWPATSPLQMREPAPPGRQGDGGPPAAAAGGGRAPRGLGPAGGGAADVLLGTRGTRHQRGRRLPAGGGGRGRGRRLVQVPAPARRAGADRGGRRAGPRPGRGGPHGAAAVRDGRAGADGRQPGVRGHLAERAGGHGPRRGDGERGHRPHRPRADPALGVRRAPRAAAAAGRHGVRPADRAPGPPPRRTARPRVRDGRTAPRRRRPPAALHRRRRGAARPGHHRGRRRAGAPPGVPRQRRAAAGRRPAGRRSTGGRPTRTTPACWPYASCSP